MLLSSCFLTIFGSGILAYGFWEWLGTISLMGVPDEELKETLSSLRWKACLLIIIGITGLCVATPCVVCIGKDRLLKSCFRP